MASAMVLDKSLDEIISDKKKNTRRPRRAAGAAKAAITGQSAAQAATRRAATAPATTTPVTGNVLAEKIIVSNLPTDVNEAQVKELFQTTVGPTTQCQLQYSQDGRSLGIATVKFTRRGDANKAFQQYNNRLIDGKRPMKIELILDPTNQPLVNRVAPAAKGTTRSAGGAGGAGGTGPAAGKKPAPRRGRQPRAKRPAKTAEDLDQEMADYKDSTGAAATAA